MTNIVIRKRILMTVLFILLLVIMLAVFLFVLTIAVQYPQRINILSTNLDVLIFPTMVALFSALSILFIIIILTLTGYLEKTPNIVLNESKTEKIKKGEIAPWDGWLITDGALAKLLEAGERSKRDTQQRPTTSLDADV